MADAPVADAPLTDIHVADMPVAGARARVLQGQPASPGRVCLPIHVLADVAWRDADPFAAAADAGGDAARSRLHDAIAAARADIARDLKQLDGKAAAILAAHDALLDDPELRQAALRLMETGHGAAAAWRQAIETERAACASGGDPVIAARAADFDDLRDRVLVHLLPPAAAQPPIPQGVAVLADDLTLSRFLAHDWSQGGAILLLGGSAAGHVAMLARTRGVPMVVGLAASGRMPLGGRAALIDGAAGTVALDPPPEAIARALAAPADAMTTGSRASAPGWDSRSGGRSDLGLRIALNVNHPDELQGLDPAGFDGIGLVRTELLFQPMSALPDEEAQYAAYRHLLGWADGRPVIVRVFDAGGDKPLPGLTVTGERNPFLGLRGIRLLLARPGLLDVQLRALARAAMHGDLQVLLPMVTLPSEVDAAQAMLEEAVAALHADGVAARCPPLGMMVETPAAALASDGFEAAAFLSIGTNDLTQYVMAAGRDNAAVAHLADPLGTPMLRLIATVASDGARRGRPVSLCGDAAADPRCIAALLQAGIRSVSVPAHAVAAVRQAAARVGERSS